jgi:hypothetical protein
LSRIRIKKLDIEVHKRTVLQGHDEAETLLGIVKLMKNRSQTPSPGGKLRG